MSHETKTGESRFEAHQARRFALHRANDLSDRHVARALEDRMRRVGGHHGRETERGGGGIAARNSRRARRICGHDSRPCGAVSGAGGVNPCSTAFGS